MPDNLTTDAASNLDQAAKKQAIKNNKTARKVFSRAKNGSRKSTKRAARASAAKASRFMGSAKSALNDAYGWAGDSSKKVTKAARKAVIPSEYANDRALIMAAVGLGASVAVGALIMGYGGFGAKRRPPTQPSSRRRSNRKA